MKKIFFLTIFVLSIIFSGYAQNISTEKFDYSYKMVRLDSTFDAAIDKKLDKYVTRKRNKMNKEMQRVIAQSERELESFPPESPLSNFLTDILLKESPKYIANPEYSTIDISILNFGGIRANLPAGNVTVGDMYRISPFENYLTFISLKGSELRKALSRFNDKFSAPYSGAVLTFSKNGISRILIGNEPLSDEKIYTLVTLNFISDGGDGILKDVKFEKITYTQTTFREFLISELTRLNEKGIVIKSDIDGRAK